MAVISVKLLNERNSDLWDKYKDLGMFEQNPRLNWDPDIGYYTGVYTGWPEEDDYEVFSDCKKTKHITTESYARVSWATFLACESLETLTLGRGNEILPRQLCEGCLALRSVELPNDIYRIDDRAFYGCENLEQINIPESVMYIDPTAFAGCTKLPSDVLERIHALSDKETFDKKIDDVEQYIRTHGDAKYRFGNINYNALFRKNTARIPFPTLK